MVGTFFKSRFRLIYSDLENYEWRNSQWQQKMSSPSRRMYDYMITQRFSDNANVEISGETNVPQEEGFAKKKAYIVWYSGENYGVRREISVIFWASTQKPPNGGQIRAWLNKAIKSAIVVDITDIENWIAQSGKGMAYQVDEASLGLVMNAISDYDYQQVEWSYSKNGSPTKTGMFYK